MVQAGLPPGEREAHAGFDGPSILIVTEGSGTLTAPEQDDDHGLKWGSVVSVGARIGVTFSSGRVDRLVLYHAYCP
jgi:mannose-6-phosphate isomerase class I